MVRLSFISAEIPVPVIIGLAVAAVLLIFCVIFLILCYKKCPEDKLIVVYGLVGKDKDGNRISVLCVRGARFVWPIFQAYKYLDLNPYNIQIDDKVFDSCDESMYFSVRLNVAISVEKGKMQYAAERLLGLSREDIQLLVTDLAEGQLRYCATQFTADEIKADRDKFLTFYLTDLTENLDKMGIRIVGFNASRIAQEK